MIIDPAHSPVFPAGFVDPISVSDDPFWKTDEGWRQREEMSKEWATVAASEAEAKAAAQTKELAEWKARVAERKHAEEQEQAELERVASGVREVALAARLAEQKKAQAARVVLAQQDPDYHALQIKIDDWLEGLDSDDGDEWFDLNGEALRAEAKAPWLAHYSKMGLIRADHLVGHLMGGHAKNSTTPKFYLVFRAEDAAFTPEALGELPSCRLPLNGPDGGELLEILGAATPVNATRLYNAIRECSALAASQGGEATPELFPRDDEGRDDWLARACMPTDRLEQAVVRWERCGADLELFALAGSVSDQPIEWVVPGLIPRGYVSLLVGDSMVGKSTLLSEMAAVIDSQSEAPRAVLGTEITVRGISAIVTGEDGPNIVGARAKVYEQVHGPTQSYLFDLAERPWPKILELLHRIPALDFVCIDPLRALFDGDEDVSGNFSRVFNELNVLARGKNCAVVLAHHFGKKGARSLSQAAQATRGSGVATQRPRIGIAMIDRGSGVVEVGIFNHNFPPSEEMWGDVNVGRRFRQDAETMTLVPVDASPEPKSAAPTASMLELVVEAVRHYNGLNVVLRRTGKCELFERKAPQLLSMSRHAIREAVATLLAAGRLVDGPDGIRGVDGQFPDAPPS